MGVCLLPDPADFGAIARPMPFLLRILRSGLSAKTCCCKISDRGHGKCHKARASSLSCWTTACTNLHGPVAHGAGLISGATVLGGCLVNKGKHLKLAVPPLEIPSLLSFLTITQPSVHNSQFSSKSAFVFVSQSIKAITQAWHADLLKSTRPARSSPPGRSSTSKRSP